MTNQQLRDFARLKELLAQYPEPWKIEKKPHNYNDGTKEFTHVRYYKERGQETICVSIGECVTPDLAELLILLRDLVPPLAAECDRLRFKLKACKRQAQIWKGEASAHKASLHECYQVVTGASGEPGDWNGARPIREAFSRLRAENEKLLEALRAIVKADDEFQKMLPDNWDGDPVTDACNAARHLLRDPEFANILSAALRARRALAQQESGAE